MGMDPGLPLLQQAASLAGLEKGLREAVGREGRSETRPVLLAPPHAQLSARLGEADHRVTGQTF